MKTHILKKIAAFAAALAIPIIIMNAFSPSDKQEQSDASGHRLASKWKLYEKYVKNDLPQKQEAVLLDIIEESSRKNMSWDFYDALAKYRETVANRDWKKWSEMSEKIKDAVEEYDYPVVTWNVALSGIVNFSNPFPSLDSLKADKRLLSRRSEEFYGNDFLLANGFPAYLRENISCDYEYMLWSWLNYNKALASAQEKVTSTAEYAKEFFNGKYPQSAYVAYLELAGGDDIDAMKKFAEEYSGKAVGLFAEAALLADEFDELKFDEASSDEFKAFREKCADFEKRRTGFSGDEGKLVKELTQVKDLAESMDAPGMRAWVENDGLLHITLKNLDKAEVLITENGDKKTAILDTAVQNPVRSYYLQDTVKVSLPKMNDGKYAVKCTRGKAKVSFEMNRHTISTAMQFDKDGACMIYAADWMTGKPAEKVDVSISLKGNEVWSVKGLVLDGFTRLGNDFASVINQDARYNMTCSYTDEEGFIHKSLGNSFNPVQRTFSISGDIGAGEQMRGTIFKDRAAFNPGDTLNFKAIIYKLGTGSNAGKNAVADEGTAVTAELLDSESKTVDTMELKTNAFGSVSGMFRLPSDRRNGNFTLRILYNGTVLCSSGLAVDEFKLPNFTISFDPVDKIYLPGDTVRVTGRVESYSGRSLSSASISYKVTDWTEDFGAGEIALADDGKFEIAFVSAKEDEKDYYYYNVSLKMTDATGETYEASTGVTISAFHLSMELENEASGRLMRNAKWNYGEPETMILESDSAKFSFSVKNGNWVSVATDVHYRISKDGKILGEDTVPSDETVCCDLSGWGAGVFRIEAETSKGEMKDSCVYDLVLTYPGDTVLNAGLEHYFKVIGTDGIKAQFGAGNGTVWAVLQLLGSDMSILHSELLHLEGVSGKPGSLVNLEYGFKDEYPETVRLRIIYFRNGEVYEISHDYKKPVPDMNLPLEFSRFTEKAYSGEKCTYELTTLPGTECVVSVFDKSTETFRSNWWNRISVPSKPEKYVYCHTRTGDINGRGYMSSRSNGEAVPFQLADEQAMFKASASDAVMREDVLSENSVAYGMAPAAPAADEGAGAADVAIREDFRKTLAFLPHLYPDADGKIRFSFDAGDKLSTFYVSVFAHDKSLKNNVLRKQTVISLPVELSVVQPDWLYENDFWSLKFGLSNLTGNTSEGTVTLYIYEGTDHENLTPSMVCSKPCSIAAGKSVGDSFGIEIPEGADTLGLKLVYRSSDGFSDGIFVSIPVRKPVQTLTESHSAVCLDGMSEDSLYNVLRSQFVNTTGENAMKKAVSLRELLMKAVPDSIGNGSKDVVSVSGTMLAEALAARISGEKSDKVAEMVGNVISYQNADGGFGWFKGANSSPVMTALVLERFATMKLKALDGSEAIPEDALAKAVGFLDANQFSDEEMPLWCGGISLGQYLYIRSAFNGIPLSADVEKNVLKKFRKTAKEYLLPGKQHDPAGYILAKARRMATIMNFIDDETEGATFLSSIGLKAEKKMKNAAVKYMASLKEYAVAHPSGGTYYPNAVMPFRGLLENEVYAHSLICDLLSRYGKYADDARSSEIAEGIRLWIMLQKETQQWSEDPAYLFAINSVTDGSEALMNTRILILSETFEKPFEEIEAASNGLSVKCTYYKVTDGPGNGAGVGSRFGFGGNSDEGLVMIKDGDMLAVGDKVIAVYEIWSQENRSFVKLSAPRHACLRPENQLSGYAGLGISPLRLDGFRIIYPFSYREVKAEGCNWYFDVLPEEKMEIRETMFVTQAGRFSSAAAEIECLYAPHYRGNDGHTIPLMAE